MDHMIYVLGAKHQMALEWFKENHMKVLQCKRFDQIET